MKLKSYIASFAIVLASVSLTACGSKQPAQTADEDQNPMELREDTPDINIQTQIAKALQIPDDKPIVVDFNAVWCGPCREFSPIYEATSEKYASVATFAEVDVDNYQELTNMLGITSIPTVMVFTLDGQIYDQIGLMTAQEFEQFLNESGISLTKTAE